MSKHTPGPWTASPLGCETSHGLPTIHKANGHLVAELCDRNMANARLIAAAPELLAFAIAAMDYLQHPDGHHTPPGTWLDLNVQVRAAIAKATGDADEAALVQTDLAYARMKDSGELRRREERRALEIQVQQEGMNS